MITPRFHVVGNSSPSTVRRCGQIIEIVELDRFEQGRIIIRPGQSPVRLAEELAFDAAPNTIELWVLD